jgi:hypothetical protein
MTLLDSKAEPILSSPEAEGFYVNALHELSRLPWPFLIAGTYALSAYTGIVRETKDLDILCKPGDCPRILGHFRGLGYAIEIWDERWLAKVYRGEHFFDLVFGCASGTTPVDDVWFEDARRAELLGATVPLVSPTEFIWSKAFIQERERYDGADIAHLILKRHDAIDWRRLLSHMELHWEVLLMHLLNFRWVYPSERDHVPRWLMDELLDRLREQVTMPPPQVSICRGRMFSRADYEIDVRSWGFGDVASEGA